jgi:N6-L-threonylcarbamoyladenine synthase
MALALSIPVSVNHMQAHILAHFMMKRIWKPSFPFLALTISGGHTQIVQVNDFFHDYYRRNYWAMRSDKSAKNTRPPYPAVLWLISMPNWESESICIYQTGLNFIFQKTAILYFVKS